jgi:hypothetical protein
MISSDINGVPAPFPGLSLFAGLEKVSSSTVNKLTQRRVFYDL